MAVRREGFPLPDVHDPRTAGYFAAAADGFLALPRCAACGRLVWYPEERCPDCGGGELPWTPVEGRGTLFSWAVVRRAFLPAFADMVPFVTGLVALDVDPRVRLVTYVVDVVPDALVAGLPVQAVFRPLMFPTVPGRQVTVPMFVPAR